MLLLLAIAVFDFFAVLRLFFAFFIVLHFEWLAFVKRLDSRCAEWVVWKQGSFDWLLRFFIRKVCAELPRFGVLDFVRSELVLTSCDQSFIGVFVKPKILSVIRIFNQHVCILIRSLARMLLTYLWLVRYVSEISSNSHFFTSFLSTFSFHLHKLTLLNFGGTQLLL